MIPQDTCSPRAVALRDSSEIFSHRGLVNFIVRSSEHHTGGSADEPFTSADGKITDESVDRSSFLRRHLHFNRADAPLNKVLLYVLWLTDDTEGLKLQDGGRSQREALIARLVRTRRGHHAPTSLPVETRRAASVEDEAHLYSGIPALQAARRTSCSPTAITSWRMSAPTALA